MVYGTRDHILFDLDDLPVLLPVFQVALEVYGSRERILFDLDDLPVFLPVFQVALEVYGTRERILFHLNDYDTKLGILNAIAVPYFTGGTTNTAAALRAMREQIFTPQRVCTNFIGYVLLTEGLCITQRGYVSST